MFQGIEAPVVYRKYTFSYKEIGSTIGAATSGDIPLVTLPQGALLLYAYVKHSTQFVFSGGAGTFKVSIGISTSATLFTAASADLVATAVAATAYTATASTAVPVKPNSSHAALAVVMNCVSSVANVNTLTAGVVSAYLCWVNPVEAFNPGDAFGTNQV